MKDGEQFGPMPGNGERGGAAYQPLDPRELLRFPAADQGCLAVRGMLRDYADDDLDQADRDLVDEHVHDCRDCSLALSRAELEVLRIRKATRELRDDAADVPSRLTGRVLAAVGRAVVAEPDTPLDFTSAVMDRVRREWRRETVWEQARRKLGYAPVWAAAAAAALVLFAFAGQALWLDKAHEGLCLEMVAAGGAVWIDQDDGLRAARAGQLMESGVALRSGPRLGAKVALRDLGAEAAAAGGPNVPGPIVRIALDAASELRFDANGALSLSSGAAELRVERALAMGIVGLGELEIEPGEYAVSVDQVQRFDGGLGGAAMPRARVEVLSGDLRLRRGAGQVVRLRSGQVARFDAVSEVEISAALTDSLLARSWQRGRGVRVADDAFATGEGALLDDSLTGQVVRASDGSPVAEASVTVVVGGKAQTLFTGSDGRFRLALPIDDGAEVTVQVIPSAESELASFGPLPRTVRVVGGSRRELARIALHQDFPVHGNLRTAEGVVAGADIVPCLVDEAFGMVERLDELLVHSDADGNFALHALPTGLAAHQVLALLVEDPRLPTTASVRLGRRLAPAMERPLDILVPAARRVVFAGLAENAEYPILREIPGLPLTVVAEVSYRRSDAQGMMTVDDLGVGTLWLVEGERVFATRADADGQLRIDRSLSIAHAELGRMGGVERSFGFLGDPAEIYRRGHRFLDAVNPSAEDELHYLSVYDPSRAIVPAARIFALQPSGELSFVGEANGAEMVGVSEEIVEPFRLLAVGRDGSLGQISFAEIDGGYLRVEEPGRVSLGESVGEVGLLAFDALDGVLAGRTLWRVCEDGAVLGSLPVGSYRVRTIDGRGGRCELSAGQDCVLELR